MRPENKKVLEVDPRQIDAYGNLGFLLVQQGKIDEGIEIYRKALTIHKNVPQIHANLGHAYLLKGDLDKAIEANQRALEISEGFGPAHNNLALLYAQKGDRESARRHLEEAERVGFPVIPELRKELLIDEEK